MKKRKSLSVLTLLGWPRSSMEPKAVLERDYREQCLGSLGKELGVIDKKECVEPGSSGSLVPSRTAVNSLTGLTSLLMVQVTVAAHLPPQLLFWPLLLPQGEHRSPHPNFTPTQTQNVPGSEAGGHHAHKAGTKLPPKVCRAQRAHLKRKEKTLLWWQNIRHILGGKMSSTA